MVVELARSPVYSDDKISILPIELKILDAIHNQKDTLSKIYQVTNLEVDRVYALVRDLQGKGCISQLMKGTAARNLKVKYRLTHLGEKIVKGARQKTRIRHRHSIDNLW